MATNTTDSMNRNTKDDTNHNNDQDTTSVYDGSPEIDPTVNPDEEVTPKNVQAPVSDEDKLKQDNVLAADHVRLGFPANGVPRTDDERKKMEEAGLLDKK